MKKIIIASALCSLTLLNACSNSGNASTPKGQIAHEEKYIIVKAYSKYTYGTQDFGRYFIFHEDGTFDDVLKDGSINQSYIYYVDSLGDFYYRKADVGHRYEYHFDIWTGTITKERFTMIGPEFDSIEWFAINENSEMYATLK